MATVTIGGQTYTGNNISVRNGKVIIDGVEALTSSGPVIDIIVSEGVIQNLTTDGNVHAQNVTGDITAGGSINCVNVMGDVQCGGSVKAENVSGDIMAGGSVTHNTKN